MIFNIIIYQFAAGYGYQLLSPDWTFGTRPKMWVATKLPLNINRTQITQIILEPVDNTDKVVSH